MAWSDKLADMLRLNDGDQAYVGYPQMQVGLNQPRQAGYATGFLEGATGMPSMQPKNPITDPNYDAYAQGKNVGELVGIGAMAVPAYAGVLRAGAPKAYNALENYMVKSGGMIPLEAYHGTPHKIQGQFDISKVGTGEGAQSYGHGMYFAENPVVAKQYANELGSKIDVNGKPLYQANKTVGSTGNTELDDYLVANLGDVKATRKQLLNDIKEIRPTNPEAAKEMQTTLADLRKANVGVQNTGNLYKVDIPDEHIPNMLDWDKPFKNQTPSVQAAIKQLEPKIKQINPNLNVENLDGKGIYHAYQQYRGNQPDFASEGMNELGIKGIRYLDQGSRNPGFSSLTPTQLQSRIESLQTDINSGGGNQAKMKDQLKALQNEMDSYKNMTSNFVVFDPSTVKILEENGIPTRKELIQQQIDKIE